MSIKLKVVMCSGEIYNFYFENLSNGTAFADRFEDMISEASELNDAIEAVYFVISDGAYEMSVKY